MIRRTFHYLAAALLLTVISACVTINVYFPEAQTTEAAQEFIDRVIGPDQPSPPPPVSSGGGAISALLNLLIPAAHAQAKPNVDIDTPAIRAIQARMAERFEAKLKVEFDRGRVGLTQDARIALRDAQGLALKDRSALTALINEDNRDRDAVYRELAVANAQPAWEAQIREIFAREWIAKARPGWYYQDTSGAWQKK
jgi:uncharacterized protein YdbL (DUF1318 family)